MILVAERSSNSAKDHACRAARVCFKVEKRNKKVKFQVSKVWFFLGETLQKDLLFFGYIYIFPHLSGEGC